MRTIKIEFTVSERQYEYLKLAKSEQPNAQRIKMMLLSQAASTLRREGEMVMAEERVPRKTWEQEQVAAKLKGKGIISWKDMSPAEEKRDIDVATRKLKRINAKLNRKPDKVLRNSKADKAVPFTPTPIEDYEF